MLRVHANLLLTGSLTFIIVLAGVSCSSLKLPTFFFGEEPLPKTPINVTLEFTKEVREAMVSGEACGEYWEMSVGHAVTKEFLDAGEQAFASARILSEAAPDKTAPPTNMVVRVSLVKQSFTPETRTTDSEQYLADMSLQLLATYLDPDGNILAEIPLTYLERVSIWTPLVGTGGIACATGQLDAAVENGAHALARQMVYTAYTIFEESPQMAATIPTEPAPRTAGTMRPRVPRTAPDLAVRATLLDSNDNLILEGGEKIGVRVEATNTGQALIPSATVTLAGTPTLIDTFAQTTASTTFGPFKPGETRRTEIWGRMPQDVTPERGELSVSVSTSSKDEAGNIHHSLPVSQTLVAAIRPGSPSQKPDVPTPGTRPPASEAVVAAKGPETAPASENHANTMPEAGTTGNLAILVALEQYRDPWATLQTISSNVNALRQNLTTHAGFSESRVLVLNNRQATRSDLERTVFQWLPQHADAASTLFFYFSGQAVTDPRFGEVFLVPYEGSPGSSHLRLVSLRALQRALLKVPAKVHVLVIHAPTTVLEHSPFGGNDASSPRGASPARIAVPNWKGALQSMVSQEVATTSKASSTVSPTEQADAGANDHVPSPLIQVVFSDHHLNETASLLSALQGDADVDLNGRMTLRELLHALQGKASIIPDLPGDAPEADLEIFQLTGER